MAHSSELRKFYYQVHGEKKKDQIKNSTNTLLTQNLV